MNIYTSQIKFLTHQPISLPVIGSCDISRACWPHVSALTSLLLKLLIALYLSTARTLERTVNGACVRSGCSHVRWQRPQPPLPHPNLCSIRSCVYQPNSASKSTSSTSSNRHASHACHPNRITASPPPLLRARIAPPLPTAPPPSSAWVFPPSI